MAWRVSLRLEKIVVVGHGDIVDDAVPAAHRVGCNMGQATRIGCGGLVVALLIGCVAAVREVRPAPPFTAIVGPVIVAHRGGSLEVPENTLAAVRHGIRVGADWQEIDVTLSKDGHVVVFHDDTLERTTGAAGAIEGTTLEALRALSTGQPKWSVEATARLASFGVTPPDFGDAFAHETVPTLEEILAAPGGRLMIELKQTTRKRRLVHEVLDVVSSARAYDRVALASFEAELLEEAYRRDPTIPLIGIAADEQGIRRQLELPLAVLAVRADLARRALELAPAGMAVWAWPAYTVDHAVKLRDAGVHGIITDVPKATVDALRADSVPSSDRSGRDAERRRGRRTLAVRHAGRGRRRNEPGPGVAGRSDRASLTRMTRHSAVEWRHDRPVPRSRGVPARRCAHPCHRPARA